MSQARRIAVLLAGGIGTRMGAAGPKQLIDIDGVTIFERSLRAFHAHPEIDEVIVLMAPGYLDAARDLVAEGSYSKVTQIVEGGNTRTESTLNALHALAPSSHADAHVLFHDAVRPFVTGRIITDCLNALMTHAAVTVAIPSTDTIIETSGGRMTKTLVRSPLRRLQTPQGFHQQTLEQAYELALQDPNFEATDDASVVLRYLPNVEIAVVEGDETNIKITTPFDLAIAQTITQA